MLPANGWIAGSILTKVLESWPKGFWYEYKAIGEGFCRGCELIWRLHNAMKATVFVVGDGHLGWK